MLQSTKRKHRYFGSLPLSRSQIEATEFSIMFMKNKQLKDRELETFFSIQHIIKQYIISRLVLKKNKLGKCRILDQNRGLSPLRKCKFFDLENFFFYPEHHQTISLCLFYSLRGRLPVLKKNKLGRNVELFTKIMG